MKIIKHLTDFQLWYAFASWIISSGTGAFSGLITFAAANAFSNGAPLGYEIKNFLVVFLFGLIFLPFGLISSLIISFPLFIVIWTPLWIAREKIRWFWKWFIAPIIGGLLGISFIKYLIIYHNLNPINSVAHEEHIYVYPIAGFIAGFSMFLMGCLYDRIRKNY